ncbi:major facilitator superfamily domain-containing protein [Aspergillus pseudoustus]|uniref:Major facilitator superfamily domain-containing protein n=1 Tax=Aspergillus pseudoustus TaxID=1810923 RepID=A0ABR4J6K0_9EURO
MEQPSEGVTQHWPPGTMLLQTDREHSKEIVLQPKPTNDPNDPLNWEPWRKYLNFALTCLYVLLVTEFLCAATPTWGPMHEQLGFSWATLNNSYAIGCGFLGIGAVILTPLSLKFGRRPLYLISILVVFAVSIWSAKMQKPVDIMLVNVFSCSAGALSEVMIQMTIADVFFVHQRGVMNAIFIWTAQIGGSLGPLVAGFVTVSQGWRWVWWWNVIFLGVCLALFGFLYEETKYIPPAGVASVSSPESGVQQEGKDADDKMTQTVRTRSLDERGVSPPLGATSNIPRKTYRERLTLVTATPGEWSNFGRHFWLPFVMLATMPAILYSALSYGAQVAVQNTLSTTMSSHMTLPPYNFSSDQIGLMNMPQFIGVSIGSLIVGPLSDRFILYRARQNKGIYEPETRLWLLLPFIPFVLGGALLYGIGIQKGLSWPVIAVGIGICSFGVAPINIVLLTYISDAYNDIIGDAMVGVTFIRNCVSTAFIFALDPWFASVGIQNVIISMSLIATFILSFAVVFLKWGKKFRGLTAERYQRLTLLSNDQAERT